MQTGKLLLRVLLNKNQNLTSFIYTDLTLTCVCLYACGLHAHLREFVNFMCAFTQIYQVDRLMKSIFTLRKLN